MKRAQQMKKNRNLIFALCVILLSGTRAFSEVMLQYFNTDWREIAEKMPELAEAGYDSLWLPPPTKGSGGLSVGYDLFDPFDLGGREQRGTVRTLYGTEADLLYLLEVAHRFGIRVYFDNIMNHRAFDIPGYNESTPIDIYPGMVPEDFHLRKTEEGFYRKWDNCRDWGSAWQVMNLGLSDLIDIAHETPNANFGAYEGNTYPKWSGVRQAAHPEFYLDTDLPLAVGYGSYAWSEYTFANKEPFSDVGYTNAAGAYVASAAGNGRFDWEDLNGDGQHVAGERSEPFADTGLDGARPGWQDAAHGCGDGVYNMGNPVEEDVGAYLIRAVRWLMDRTKADGLRLDAVKHVPDYFFGAFNSDTSGAGYTGGAQVQYNLSRNISDWGNHRDSVFNTEIPRDDALMFGEHLGAPPAYGGYFAAGMRLVDNELRSKLNGTLGSPWAGLNGMDQPGAGGFSPDMGVMHAQSHDNDYAACRELQHALYFTRAGLGLLYTDGNHHAGTLEGSGGAFPRWANTAYLGQWGDGRAPNLLYIHNQFARGYQRGVFADGDYVAYERLDWRQGGSTDADKVTMLVLLNDNYASGLSRPIDQGTSFPHQSGGDNAYLYNYSTYGGGFYTWASDLWQVMVPPGGYFVFSWKNPDPSTLWAQTGGKPLMIYENGKEAEWLAVERKDGPAGDPGFNPYGVPDSDANDYTYTYSVPRVTKGTNLQFIAYVDGSAANVLMKLDGGIDLNGSSGHAWDLGKRDQPPTKADDVFLGYEQADFVKRLHREKFAAKNSAHNKIGSAGATSYTTLWGSGTWTVNESAADNDWSSAETAVFVYHDPAATTDRGDSQNNGSVLWVKTGDPGNINKVVLYYTTDGTWPEGAGGMGKCSTLTVELGFDHSDSGDGKDWWGCSLPTVGAGADFRYKVGAFRQQDGGGSAPWGIVWPGNQANVDLKTTRMGVWRIDGFNGETVGHYVHNDFGAFRTGLEEGFHFIQARAFLQRDSRAAIYNTFKQTFYYDAERPQGLVRWPARDGDSIGGQQYGAVALSDRSTRELWYHIDDSDPNNDDYATGVANGNGRGFEPYDDLNANGHYDSGEPFDDVNASGSYDALLPEAWQPAFEDGSYLSGAEGYAKSWRFNAVNIPAGGASGSIKARLCEWSSAKRSAWTTNMTDVAGHFTTLARQVYTWGPDQRVFVAWPQADGDRVGAGYGMKTYFSKSLAGDMSDAQLINAFTIRIQSTVSGQTSGGVVQDKGTYAIVRNETADFHALLYNLPSLYNGQPDWLHGIEVTLSREGAGDIVATRLVRAEKGVEAPQLEIVEPKEYDSDGKPVKLIIPDKASPTAADRSMTIQLRTVTNLTAHSVLMDQWPAGYTGTISFVTNRTDAGYQFLVYQWAGMCEGAFHFTAAVQTTSGTSNSVGRSCTVILRQTVEASGSDSDDDDDGILDLDEVTSYALLDAVSSPNSDLWVQPEIQKHRSCGRSSATSPDTDGDGLPDGLELGWRVPTTPAQTDTGADTNGDGHPNFTADLDPPFYNTLDNEGSVPGVDSISKGGDRTKRVAGSVTDPANPDSDGDGIGDGVEDANRNGWADGDGAGLPASWAPWLARAWPNGKIDPGETWLETDPNVADTDGDGAADGYGEDKNFNGIIDGDSNSNRVWESGEVWLETDSLKPDTDGDGLPDGWEINYGFDPLDSGTASLRGGTPDPLNGAAADPDGDGFSNAQEYANGTNPRVADTGVPPPPGRIVVGRGEPLGVVNGKTNYVEFTDWSAEDLVALDPSNDQAQNAAVDIYRAWDGYDTSRDMVAFYAHDGGDPTVGGDGQFYFRVDFDDLQAYAENGYLDIYVAIDMNSPQAGEVALPDDVDAGTQIRYEAVVAVYGYNNGRVYVDLDRNNNTTAVGLNPMDFGLAGRDQNAANGFKQAHFNAELDAVEFSISRRALLDAGWNGLDYRSLNFQVFTTKDGTSNSPVGAGDIGGRSDLRDTIRNAWICSDYWRDQDWIKEHPYLDQWVGFNADNDSGKCAKVAFVVHGNQHIQPGNVMQDLINDGQGNGLHRALQIHDIYRCKLNLHVTPTLASALQWAKTDPATAEPWRLSRIADGPQFNGWIRELVATGTVHMLASTFSDHLLPYFPAGFNADNARLAEEFLAQVYGARFDAHSVFWMPERVIDSDVLGKIGAMGYGATVIDQDSHMWRWFGRSVALGDDGYRINRINDVACLVINNSVDPYKYAVYDAGPALALRALFSRRARSGTQDQVVTVFYPWEDSLNAAKADGYDAQVRWIANRPWLRLTALDDILAGREDVTGDSHGDAWYQINRGTAARQKLGHDWLNHATQSNYDNWYVGSANEEGLEGKVFSVRDGVALPQPYGMLYSGGVISNAWAAVAGLSNTSVLKLARSVIHASVFETAFHSEDNNNLEKFSTGDYVYPATGQGYLIGFAKVAQSQSRFAALYSCVDAWAAQAAGLTTVTQCVADVDLDGEAEYLLYNRRVCALFERIGGRMTAAWTRRPDGDVVQVVGNPVCYAGSETEAEGDHTVDAVGLGAYRTSCLKDWWVGTSAYVNDLYTVTPAGTDGFRLVSGDGKIAKTISLGADTGRFEVSYAVSGDLAGHPLYVRNGFSPDLMSLLMHGQTNMIRSPVEFGVLRVSTRSGESAVTAALGAGDGSHTAVINEDAADDNPGLGIAFHTLNMRNLPQVEQVEVYGTGSFTFALSFSVEKQGLKGLILRIQ